MNYKNANIEVCREMASGCMIRGQDISDELFLAIPNDGYYGYMFSKNNIAFNLDRVRMISLETRKIADLSMIVPENEIKITEYMRVLSYRKDIARKFEAFDGKDGKVVWINEKFLRNLDLSACRFYQQKDEPLHNVIAVEDGIPVMVLLPLRIN